VISICFLIVDQSRITSTAISSIANVRRAEGDGAGLLLIEDVGVGDGDIFKGQSIVVISGTSFFSSNLASTFPSTLASTYLMT
jgi:hypothetical protein